VAGPWGDKAPLSPDGRPHEGECVDYRRIYWAQYGVLTDAICCCERIRREQAPPT
jgi:hypothetical protein